MWRSNPTYIGFAVMTWLSFASITLADAPSGSELGLLPGDAAIAPATNSQQEHSIARGGDQYLIVWSDSRARSSGSQTIQSDGDIFGIRIDAAGEPIDAAPFMIAGGMGLQRYPKASWNGESWLVVYQSQDPVGGYFDTQVRAVRVSPLGEVLDSPPILLPPTQFSPSTIGLNVAGQAGQWLVTRCVYHDTGYGTYLAGQRIDASGQLLDATPIMLIDWVYGATRTVVSGGEYLVVGPDWTSSSTIKAQRVGLDAQPIGAAFTVPGMTIAGHGDEFYVTWVSGFVNMVGSRMTKTGTLLNPAGTLLFSDPSITFYHTNLTHDGTNWWFEWGAADTLRVLRIDPLGAVLDPGGVKLPIVIGGTVNHAYDVQLAPRGGGGVFVAWWDARVALGSDANVFAMPVSAAAAPEAERCLSTSTPNQRNPELAHGPGGALAVAFVSEAANDARVLVHLLSPAGQPIAGEPVEVHRGPTVGRVGIAFNGSIFLVAWDQGASGLTPTQIKARRMNPDGSFLDAQPFDVMPGFNAAVAALGDDFLVAGARVATYPQFIDLFARRFDGPTGAALDGPSGVLLHAGYVNAAPRVRTDGAQWLVTAHSHWSHDSPNSDAILARVSASGAVTKAVNPTPVAGGTGDLDLAFSGNKYLLVWRMNTLASANNYIAGRIMNADGTLPPGYFTIAEAPGRQLRPTATWDGATFIVAWDDQRNQKAFFDQRTDVYAARVSETGSVLDPAGIPIVVGPEGDASASMVSDGGATFVATTRFTLDGGFDSYRVGLTRLGEIALAGDIDGDGDVDQSDLGALLANYGLCAGDPGFDPAADLDGDGCVGQSDLGVLLAGYGQ